MFRMTGWRIGKFLTTPNLRGGEETEIKATGAPIKRLPALRRTGAGSHSEHRRSNLIVENAHGEPITAARGANEEHRAVAHNRWRGTQDIVNFEVAVRRQLDARKGRAVLDKGGLGNLLHKSAWQIHSVPSPFQHCCRHPKLAPFL